jgi:hypothetical protein
VKLFPLFSLFCVKHTKFISAFGVHTYYIKRERDREKKEDDWLFRALCLFIDASISHIRERKGWFLKKPPQTCREKRSSSLGSLWLLRKKTRFYLEKNINKENEEAYDSKTTTACRARGRRQIDRSILLKTFREKKFIFFCLKERTRWGVVKWTPFLTRENEFSLLALHNSMICLNNFRTLQD